MSGLRALIAVGIAAVVLGGLAGFGIHAVTDGDDGRMGRFGPGGPGFPGGPSGGGSGGFQSGPGNGQAPQPPAP
jgi:hypothetical protein